jgi:ATP-dependent DNA helicase RecG
LQPLQTALGLEAERGCPDLQGRQERFHAFLSRQLQTPPPCPLPADSQQRLAQMAASFAGYPQLNEAARRRLVTSTRQWLHDLRQRLEPSTTMAPPRLRFDAPPTPAARTPSPSPSRQGGQPTLDTPLGQVKGVGPKLAERLAALGLLLVRDLLLYYPRDYVD